VTYLEQSLRKRKRRLLGIAQCCVRLVLYYYYYLVLVIQGEVGVKGCALEHGYKARVFDMKDERVLKRAQTNVKPDYGNGERKNFHRV
jgi:hypothetical protein